MTLSNAYKRGLFFFSLVKRPEQVGNQAQQALEYYTYAKNEKTYERYRLIVSWRSIKVSLCDTEIGYLVLAIIENLLISDMDIYQIGWYNILNVENVCIFPQINTLKEDGYKYGIR